MSLLAIARGLIITGILLVAAGGVLYLAARFGLPLGRLPGDFVIKRENFSLFIPLASMLIISLILTIVLNLLIRLLNR